MKFQTVYPAAMLWIAALMFTGPHSGLYAGETTVEIHSVDDRVKATITSPRPVVADAEPRSIEKPILAVEDTTIGVAGKSTKLVGKGTDAAVDTVQKVGDSFFSRFFRALDVSRWSRRKDS